MSEIRVTPKFSGLERKIVYMESIWTYWTNLKLYVTFGVIKFKILIRSLWSLHKIELTVMPYGKRYSINEKYEFGKIIAGINEAIK